MPYSTYRPELMGTAWLEGPNRVEAGSMQEMVLIYRAGKFGIDDSGSIKIGLRFATDMGAVQFDDPAAPGYTTAEASNGAALTLKWEFKRNIRPWSRSLYVGVSGDYIAPGDTITLRFGDRRKGGQGIRMQTYCEAAFEWRVFVDAFATYDYIPLQENPRIAIVPGAPVHWHAVVPSRVAPGEAFCVGLKAEDRWRNPSDRISERVVVVPNEAFRDLPDHIDFTPGNLTAAIKGVALDSEGMHVLEFITANGFRFQSNPIQIATAGPYRLAWGDTHGQSNETLGTNTAAQYFTFGRDVAFLDVIGHQGNDFQITDDFWAELNRVTAEYDQPGRFVCIPGYEWSANTAIGGDRNIHYMREGEPIIRSSHAQITDLNTELQDAHDAGDLFARLNPEKCVVVAHVGGRYADIRYAHDARMEHAVEVHSSWGTFEWIVEDAMRAGYRVGIVANSDGHKGRPGACYPGASFFGSMGGLTCFLTADVTREGIFEAMRARRHYATTGARIMMEVHAGFGGPFTTFTDAGMTQSQPGKGPQPMGAIVRSDGDHFRFDADITGTSPLERIDIFDGLGLVETIHPWQPEAASRRLRITYEGAACRGRSRAILWTGEVRIGDNELRDAQIVNNWNLDRGIRRMDASGLSWSAVTTGNFGALDLTLRDGTAGQVAILTDKAVIKVDIGQWDGGRITRNAGGMAAALSLQRLPEVMPVSAHRISREFTLEKGQERRIYLRVQQTDGHRAWSSPIYVSR